jgi:hypothetical protein
MHGIKVKTRKEKPQKELETTATARQTYRPPTSIASNHFRLLTVVDEGIR